MRNRGYYLRLSKLLSLALRHRPRRFGLELDRQGFASLEQLLSALRRQPRWQDLSEEEVLDLLDRSDKKRFEVVEGKIRALYGHSVSVQVQYPETEPPPDLYHGTARRFVSRILKEGLKPQGRRYVHLSVKIEEAFQVGRRRDPDPAILRIKTKEAHQFGIRFLKAGESVVLTEEIPPEFLEIIT